MYILTTSIKHCTEVLASKIRQEKEIKVVLIGKEVKLYLQMADCQKSDKICKKDTGTNKFSMLARHKTNIKNYIFIY